MTQPTSDEERIQTAVMQEESRSDPTSSHLEVLSLQEDTTMQPLHNIQQTHPLSHTSSSPSLRVSHLSRFYLFVVEIIRWSGVFSIHYLHFSSSYFSLHNHPIKVIILRVRRRSSSSPPLVLYSYLSPAGCLLTWNTIGILFSYVYASSN